MKLYASPFACSMGPHIALREAQIDVTIEWVDLATKRTQSGANFLEVNPKGKVSTLVLDSGAVLTENIAILRYIGSLAPALTLASQDDEDGERSQMRLDEWLAFTSTEIHKQVLAIYFNPAVPEAMRDYVTTTVLPNVLRHPERALSKRPFLLGSDFCVADAYLFWATMLLPRLGVKLEASYPNLAAFKERMLARPSVQTCLGLEKAALRDRTGSHGEKR
ncbi:MAG: glutathione S-transferase family protein [Myxococcota bacterium]